ncbi:winged helix-turn-helix domain-containing protein [Streptomyces sp. NPDC002073]|uniref:winged helix-turn-helix domain-containing protein n=1 Tax=Streptomyces sp. NBC_00239 TaxID=2903640 RepID=UPI002E2B8BA2|nr:winged helix-turn-helix domain-containing protein [Streptomyces sp. NBC_00239]
MANTRTFSTAATSAATAPLTFPSHRHRLRAVDRDEVQVPRVADFLPPGATWLPAPPHTLPALPGQPPMVGYLVLVPADQQPPVALAAQAAAAARAAAPAAHAPAHTSAPAPAGTRGDALVRIDPAQRTAEVDGEVLDLTYLEFELLAHLVAHPHRVHSRDQLVTTVWGYGHVGDGRTVDVHVARLRRKLGPAHRGAIQTVRRVGYKYAP